MATEGGWRVIGCSVRGASHERNGLPNQDAIGWLPAEGRELPLMLAVSDGHGSPKSFRSDIGARLAIEAALASLRELVDARTESTGHSAIKRIAEEWLPQMIARRWSEAVQADVVARPFEPTELERLEATQGQRVRAAVELHPRQAYGSTLLALLVTEAFLLYVQIGDGDILAVTDEGQVARPLPRDERLFANETTSLSADEAWHDARVAFQVVAGAHPALIVLSTDGYANSFRSEQEFLKVGPDLLAILRQEGLGAVAEALPDWLAEASRDGSGDDVTVGILCRLAALVPPETRPDDSTELARDVVGAPTETELPDRLPNSEDEQVEPMEVEETTAQATDYDELQHPTLAQAAERERSF